MASIAFPPTDLKTTLTQVEAGCLIQKMVSGDIDAKQRFIEHHIALALSVAVKYSKRFHNDELGSAACLGLCEAVERIANGTTKVDENYVRYILAYIHTYIKDFIQRDRVVHVPENSRRRNDITIVLLNIEAFSTDEDTMSHVTQIHDELVCKPDPFFDFADIKTVSSKLKLNAGEKMYLEQKLDGKNETQIAKTLGCSRQTVLKYKIGLQTKFQALMEKE